MAYWRDSLQEASWRDFPFYYDSVQSEVGRRTVTHEYPGRDEVDVEDLGRLPLKIQIEAFVVGEGYQTRRDELVRRFEQVGSGELVHPYWGKRTCSVDGPVRVTESTREGGMARISVTLIEVGERSIAEDVEADTADLVGIAADNAIEVLADEIEEGYSTIDLIEDAVDSAQTALEAGFQKVREIKGDINNALNLVDDGLAAVDAARNAVASIITLPRTIADSVATCVNAVIGSIGSLNDAVADLISSGADANLPYSSGATSQTYRSQLLAKSWADATTFDADGATVIGTGTQATQEAVNLALIVGLFRRVTLVEVARCASVLTYDSFDRATEVLDLITEALDNEAVATDDDEVYRTLIALRAALATHLLATAAALPRVATYTLSETTPALVVAQELYGDATRADEIIVRNGIRNPAVIEGGAALEVLASG